MKCDFKIVAGVVTTIGAAIMGGVAHAIDLNGHGSFQDHPDYFTLYNKDFLGLDPLTYPHGHVNGGIDHCLAEHVVHSINTTMTIVSGLYTTPSGTPATPAEANAFSFQDLGQLLSYRRDEEDDEDLAERPRVINDYRWFND